MVSYEVPVIRLVILSFPWQDFGLPKARIREDKPLDVQKACDWGLFQKNFHLRSFEQVTVFSERYDLLISVFLEGSPKLLW